LHFLGSESCRWEGNPAGALRKKLQFKNAFFRDSKRRQQ
jgi:hypothetical protein